MISWLESHFVVISTGVWVVALTLLAIALSG